MSDDMNDKRELNKKTEKMRPVWQYCLAFLIPVIFILIHMIMEECYPFGRNTILLGDANTQYYAFFVELSERIRNGQSIFFSWDKGLGYDFYTNFCYYLASPFNLIAMAFGADYMELGMVITMLVQVGACGVTMTYFLTHTYRNTMNKGIMNSALCVVFGLSYSMCDFILAYQYNIIWLICLLLAPLVMLGVERLVESGDVRLYFVTLLLSFLCNFYFSWFVCILAVVWFIDTKKESIRCFIRRGVRFALTSIVAAASAAVVLVPCFCSVISRKSKSYTTESVNIFSTGNFADFMQSFFWGSSIDTTGSSCIYARNQYIGLFVLILSLTYLFSCQIDRRSRIKRAVLIAVFAACSDFAAAIYVLHGFSMPHMFSCRFSFILSILLIVSAFECVENYKAVGYTKIAVMSVLSVLAYIVVFYFSENTEDIACYMVTILITVYLLLILFFSSRKSITDKYVLINFIIVGLIEILANSVYVNSGVSEISKDKYDGSEYWSAVYEDINNENLDRKTSWMRGNYNMIYSDAGLFSSSMNTGMVWLYDSVGLTHQNNVALYLYKGSTPVTSVMFNVRNVLSDVSEYYGGYHLTDTYTFTDTEYAIDEEYGVYSADYTAGLAFVCPYSVEDWDINLKSPFAVQNDYVERISGVKNVFTHVDIDELDLFNVSYSTCVYEVEDKTLDLLTGVENSGNAYKYTNVTLDPDAYASVSFEFTVPRDMHLYAYIEDSNLVSDRIYIDGENTGYNQGYPSPSSMLDLGELKIGQKVEIEAINLSTQLEKGITYIDFYEYHDDKMQEFADYLQDKVMTVETVEDTYVKGTVTAAEAGILYTSIPYYKGWKAYVDGEETEIVQLADGALMGLDISAGEHTIEFRYCTYGFKPGLLISCGGIGIAAVYMVVSRRKRRRDGK